MRWLQALISITSAPINCLIRYVHFGRFPRASVAANNRIVFDIGGNRYRLIVSISYEHAAAYIKFFGTHAEYERVDANTVDHTGVIHGKAKS